MRVVEQINVLDALFQQRVQHVLGKQHTVIVALHPLCDVLVEGFDGVGIVDDEILVHVILVGGNQDNQVYPALACQADDLLKAIDYLPALSLGNIEAQFHVVVVEIEFVGLLGAEHGA